MADGAACAGPISTFLLDRSMSDVAGEGGPRRCPFPFSPTEASTQGSQNAGYCGQTILLGEPDRKDQECSLETSHGYLRIGVDERPVLRSPPSWMPSPKERANAARR